MRKDEPCPCCGSRLARLDEDEVVEEPCADRSYVFRVRCVGCGLRTAWHPTPERAVAAWNRREGGEGR